MSFFPAILLFSVAAGKPAATPEALPFIPDDYPKAIAEARSKKLPIFAEAWAPW